MPYVEPWYKTHVGIFFLFLSDSIRESFYFCSAGIAKSTLGTASGVFSLTHNAQPCSPLQQTRKAKKQLTVTSYHNTRVSFTLAMAPSSTRLLERGLVAYDLYWRRSLNDQPSNAAALDTQVLNSSAEDYESEAEYQSADSALGDKDSGIMITWYCFIAVSALVLSFVLITIGYKRFYNRVQLPAQRARRAALEAAREAALARMQANVNKFTAHENTQRTRDMCALLLPQTTEVGFSRFVLDESFFAAREE